MNGRPPLERRAAGWTLRRGRPSNADYGAVVMATARSASPCTLPAEGR